MFRMKLKLAIAGTLLALGLLACASTLKTDVGWDTNANFSKYKTWAWKPDGSIDDPVWAKRVQDVLSDQLATDGLTQVDIGQSPNLWGVVHLRLSSQTQVVSYNPGWGYAYGPWMMSDTAIYEIPVGSIVIDLVDVSMKRVVWQGKAKDVIASGKSNEEREQKLVSILAQLFATYPGAPAAPASPATPSTR
jgi:hypothetical protein